DVTVTVTNRGSGLEEVLLKDQVPHGLAIRSGHSRHLLRLASGETFTFTYTVSGPRGGYAFEALEAQVNEHLAVNSSRVRVKTLGWLVILRPLARVRQFAIRPRRTRVYAGTIPARAGGAGTEFFGVREYQPGDSPHSINWHASARHAEKLYAN